VVVGFVDIGGIYYLGFSASCIIGGFSAHYPSY
jgi:hypothetical protein